MGKVGDCNSMDSKMIKNIFTSALGMVALGRAGPHNPVQTLYTLPLMRIPSMPKETLCWASKQQKTSENCPLSMQKDVVT